MQDLEDIWGQIKDLHVVVIGDVMIDSYAWGKVDRISPEASVPIIEIESTEDRLGGAANAALNCKSLGAKVTVASVIGDDYYGEMMISLAQHAGLETTLLQKSNQRTTTRKTRILSHHQQVMRLDQEDASPLSIREEHSFIEKVLKFLQIEKPQVVIFEDYNKGVLKENVIDKIINHCRLLNIVTAVDPKKDNFLAYQGVTLFKPNLKEIKEGLNNYSILPDSKSLLQAHKSLQEQLNHQISLITLSEHGMFYADHENHALIPAHPRKIRDVSGAGDTVISVAAMWYAITQDMEQSMKVANLAGGLVCESVGVVPIQIEELKKSIQYLNL